VVEIRSLGRSGLRRSRLSCGQNVSNAAGDAEQDKRDEAPCYPKGAPSTRWPMRARQRQGLERGHQSARPNPFGAALAGVDISAEKLATPMTRPAMEVAATDSQRSPAPRSRAEASPRSKVRERWRRHFRRRD
jgi:hypothetical protein